MGCGQSPTGIVRSEPMKKSIRVDAEAEEEIEHAISRYEKEREGLGSSCGRS